MKKISVIGGGTGSYTVLIGLKKYDVDISAIVAMSDDGGSTGILRDEFGMLPPGDIRRCITALSQSPEIIKDLFQYRFEKGSVMGHTLGNLLITALKEMMKSDIDAIKAACKIFAVKGKVVPVTLDDVRLCAKLENGNLIYGESKIDIPEHDGRLKIERLFLNKKAEANPDAIKALSESDLIVIGPGDLYGSIISNLIIKGIPEAILSSKAKKVYVCNIMTKYGETNGFDSSDFYNAVVKYLGKDCIDYFIINDSIIDKKLMMKYCGENALPVKINLTPINAQCILKDVSSQSSMVRHDPERLASVIISLLQ